MVDKLAACILNSAVLLSSLVTGPSVAGGGSPTGNPLETHLADSRSKPGSMAPAGLNEGEPLPNQGVFAPIGRPIQNLQGQRLGLVEGVLLTPDGQVSAVVMATGGLLSVTRDHYAIPWTRVHWQYDGEYLSLDVGRQQIGSEFSSFEPED